MRRLILLPLVAAVLLVGCDGGVLGGGKIENFGGYSNCYYQGGIKDTFAHGKGAVYCFIPGQGLVKMFENEFCYGEYKPCAKSGTYAGREYLPGRFKLYYDGEWKDGKYHGQGTDYHSFSDGSIDYQGEFKDGQRNGQGTQYYTDGRIWYQGEFLNGRWHGQGTTYDIDGSISYQGEFCNDMPRPCK